MDNYETESSTASPFPTSKDETDLIPEVYWHSRQALFINNAVATWNPKSPLNVICHFEHARLAGRPRATAPQIGGEEFQSWFSRIDGWEDCADFDILRLLHLLYRWESSFAPEQVSAIKKRLVAFKYWYSDPTPDGITDHRWYWSENHRLIFHSIEYLAGQVLQDAFFERTGMTGGGHMERAAGFLHSWFDEKSTYGFSEWHSDVYYEKDLAALVTLAELAADSKISSRASVFLDLLLYDIALHTLKGNMGVTHGRSYMKDKSRATDQPIFGAAKLCFGQSPAPWPVDAGCPDELTPLDEGAVLLATARRYRPPSIIERVANSAVVMIDKERMGVAINTSEPLKARPVREDGLSYTDDDMVAFWWDRCALGAWQVIPLTLETIRKFELWETDLFAPFKTVRDLTGGDVEVTRNLANAMEKMVNAGILAEVNTITYRTPHVMLSTAQSYRPGCAGFQHHVWQATVGENAVVFATHPANEPWESNEARDLDHYWTGSATLPKSLQHGRVSAHLYSPGFPAPVLKGLEAFSYLDYTHAYFPTEYFDEVLSFGHWTLGRSAGGFVALYSWRETEWRRYDGEDSRRFNNGLTEPFDLIAPGGAANVWLAEVGDIETWDSFEAFRDAIEHTSVEVEYVQSQGELEGLFSVKYASPSEGLIQASSSGPLVVNGTQIPIDGYLRFDNPWSTSEFGSHEVTVSDHEGSVTLNLMTGERRFE